MRLVIILLVYYCHLMVLRCHICDTSAMAFDFGAWLVGLLADAARKKLTVLVLGSEQERELRQAAIAAIEATVTEMAGPGAEQIDQLRMIINQVLSFDSVPDIRAAERVPLLEVMQSEIGRQLALLEDAEITGIDKSPAELLGLQGRGQELAYRITGHLIREIILRGSRGRPLTPLANQLNHDATHLQVKQLEGIIVEGFDEIRAALAFLPARPQVTSQAVRLLPQPEFLAGRDVLLADLDTRLSSPEKDSPRVVIVSGLGGVGKTSLALEYAYRHKGKLRVAWMLTAEEPTALAASFQDLAAQLDGHGVRNGVDPVAYVHGLLAERAEDWLLIFDNALAPEVVRAVLPVKGRGRVIITTQNPNWPRSNTVDVPVNIPTADSSELVSPDVAQPNQLRYPATPTSTPSSSGAGRTSKTARTWS